MPEEKKSVEVNVVVEGDLDAAVIERLLQDEDSIKPIILVKRGKSGVLEALHGYNSAARHGLPWVVLVDLDRDADCAPPYRKRLLQKPAPCMRLRIAVREVEAWLLADRESLASFLKITAAKIPDDPEKEKDPKQVMVDLARKSPSSRIRGGMVPKAGGGSVGKAYTSLLKDYVSNRWNPSRAARRADSLRRAIRDIRRLVQEVRGAAGPGG